jgi:putative intracellular protease/amidase
MGTSLSGKRIGILVEENFRDPDVVVALRRLRSAGASVMLVGGGTRHAYRGEHGATVVTDCSVAGARSAQLDAVLIPGGEALDRLRECPGVLALLQATHAAGKVVAAFARGARLLVETRMLTGPAGQAASLDTHLLASTLGRPLGLVADGNVIAAPDAFSPEFYVALSQRLEQRAEADQTGPV